MRLGELGDTGADIGAVMMKVLLQDTHYLSINSVRTNGPTLCPIVWLPYTPESVEKYLQESHVAFVCKQMPKSRDLLGSL